MEENKTFVEKPLNSFKLTVIVYVLKRRKKIAYIVILSSV